MTKYIILFWTFVLTSVAAFSQAMPPTVSLEIQQGSQQDICRGDSTELFINITPPANDPGADYNFNLEQNPGAPPSGNFIRGGNSAIGADTSEIVMPQVTTTYTLTVFGQFTVTDTITVTVEDIPNAGFDTDIFLCGKNSNFPLLSELDGAPDTGGIWTDGNGATIASGDFDDSIYPNGGVFTYTLTTTGPCPDQVAMLTIRPCGNNDIDNDGIPNLTDPDDDNDGIQDNLEDSFCKNSSQLTPVFVLEEDFGFGNLPVRSRFVEGGNGLTFNPTLPQDTDKSRPGEYSVANSAHYSNQPGGIFLATTGDIDANGDTDGRYLAINMNGSFFDANNPVFEVRDLPVTPGLSYDFSMNVASTEAAGIEPHLRIDVVNQATGAVLSSVDTGSIPDANADIWLLFSQTFTPPPGVDIVSIEVINLQPSDANGNDLAIDNIFLSRDQCDFDRDGIPNSQDLDSDNDGILDSVETNTNTDGDTQPDFLDIDSDNDGIIDNVEAQTTAGYTPPSGIDSNFNGIDDAYEAITGTVITPVTTVGGLADYLNPNVDADCLDDIVEAYDADRSGALDNGEPTFSGNDSDEDGLDDAFDMIVLDRLSGGTNATNGQDINSFPNFHNPETPEKDWREEFTNIGPIPVAVGTVVLNNTPICATEDLFDDIIALFTPEGITSLHATGTWTVPGTTPLMGGNLGTLDPTDSAYIDGIYTYTIPAFPGTGCPPQVISLDVTINNACRCPMIAAPTKVGADPTTCAEATPLPTLTVAAPPAVPSGLVVRWFNDDATPVELQSGASTTYTLVRNDINNGNPITVDTPVTIRAQYYEPTNMCEGDFVDFVVTATPEPDAGTGTAPGSPLVFCREDANRTAAINLFDLLGGTPENTGSWEYTDTTKNRVVTADQNLVITTGADNDIINTVESGTFNYTVSSNGCDVTTTLEVRIDSNPVITTATASCVAGQNTTYQVEYQITSANPVTISANAAGGIGTIIQPTLNTGTGLFEGTIIDIPSFVGNTTTLNNITIIATDNVTSCVGITPNPVTALDCSCPFITPPTDSTTAATTICENDTNPTLSVNVDAGNTANWFVGTDTTVAPVATGTTSFTPAGTLATGNNVFSVIATDGVPNSTCASTPITITITVEEFADPGTGNNAGPFCREDTTRTTAINLFDLLGGTPDNTGTWQYIDANNVTVTTADQNLIINSGNANNIDAGIVSGNYTYNVNTPVCTQIQSAIITLTIAENPEITHNPPTCNNPREQNNSTYQVTYNLIGSATVTSNFGTPDPGNSRIIDIPVGQNIIITAMSPSGCIATDDVTAPDCSCPTIADPTNPVNQRICEDVTDTSTNTMSVTIATGFVGRWYAPDGTAITTAQSTNIFTPNRNDLVVGTNTYQVEAFDTTTQCTSGRVDVTFILDPAPSAGMGPLAPIAYCRDDSEAVDLFTLLGQDMDGNSPQTGGQWTLPGGGAFSGIITPSDTTFTNGQYTYTVMPPAGSTCPDDIAFIDIEFNTVPTPTAPTVDLVNCTAVALPAYPDANQQYFTAPGANGTELSPGDLIRSTTTIYLVETNGLCTAEVDFTINIENLPVVSLDELEGACFDQSGVLLDDPIVLEAPSEIDTALYELQWMFNGSDISGETNTTISIDQIGDYSLRFFLRDNTTCTAESNTVTLNNLQNPVIIDIVKEGRTVLVAATGDGLEYSLNNGPFQDSNIFRRVPFGIFTVTVRNSCIEVSQNDRLFGFPEFFTPNGDGENDFWNVRGTDDNDFEISIFDRYGNLIALFRPNDPGWNGKYNIDIDMPGDDYWYYAVRSTGEEFRGHFSLIR